MNEQENKPSNPRMYNPDGIYASQARGEDCVTLRDYFAAKAMIYFIEANHGNFCDNDASQIYYIADTMLKQREL